MARILLWVKPGSSADGLAWDGWRRRWVVSCRAPPAQGAANRAVADLVAGWLGVPAGAVRWARAGTSRAKVLLAEGITDLEAERRLRARATVEGSARSSPPDAGRRPPRSD